MRSGCGATVICWIPVWLGSSVREARACGLVEANERTVCSIIADTFRELMLSAALFWVTLALVRFCAVGLIRKTAR